ncbi:hypothetical protein EX30DRAFT_338758 [Ascodesmis nigricans]|uniref:J domain-containing protein n=1 Tax=Ascodesmis nigricans TaxID=341454 RepID=A0A4S2N4N3_9PEZI|nr:hypothetical protein EX30DRAFT_338758 [Ascodesmis nigricans]
MSTEYSYDEEGQFFPYFVASVLGLVLIPLTYSTLRPSSVPGSSKAPLINSPDYRPPKLASVEAARKRQARRERRLKRFASILIGWGVFGYMVFLIKTTETTASKIWNPYDILGISTSLSEKQIKSHYKKLSVKFHPDKIKPVGNQTIEELNDRFVEITKAYKALTDEEVRNNYIQYGHPDGKQSFSMGIALPSWIVEGHNMYFTLALYGLLFGIALPYTVGKWWYGTRRRTKDGVMVESAGRLVKEFQDDNTIYDIVDILTGGEEVKQAVTGEHEKEWSNGEDATVEKRIQQTDLPEGRFKDLQERDGWRRRALGLLWAYLYRIDLGNEKLESAKLDIAAAAMALNRSYQSIAIAFSNIGPLIASLRLSQHVVQAIPPLHSPLLQLPFFTEAVVDAVERECGKNHWTVQRFMDLPDQERRKLCIGKNLLNEDQYKTAMTFGRTLPVIRVEAAFFKVTGEKFITPASLVQFVVKMRVVPPGWTPPKVNEKDLLDVDADESDVDALLGRKDDGTDPKDKEFPLAHAPYYPRLHHPAMHLFLTDKRQAKVVVPPQVITSFDKSPANFAVVTAKMQFQAPPQPGEYTFTMMLVSDSYLGIDVSQLVTLSVSDPEKVEKIEEVDDISEPEEGSIADAMRGGGVKKPSNDDSSEEESDTDGAVDEMSETDTETEDES